MKKLLAVVLALMMVLTLAVPLMAQAEPFFSHPE